MHKLLARQTAKAKTASDGFDLERLYQLISETYEQFDQDRVRSARVSRLMIAEVETHDKAREAALEHLARQNCILDATLENMVQGVAMFDTDHRLVVCNAHYAEIYGFPPSLVVPGTPFAELARDWVARNSDLGGPPPDYNGARLEDALDVPHAVHVFGDSRIISVTRCRMQNGGWVTTHEDITERAHLHAELKKQHQIVQEQQKQLLVRNTQFDAAINNMTEGLCFFDGNQRLIIWNNRFVEMYGIAHASIYPGITLREVIDLRHAAGYTPLISPDEYYSQRMAIAVSGLPSDSQIEMANGKTFEIHHHPLPDGGWVATHEDITERRRAEARIVYMAHYDVLTDLPNRALLTERLTEAVARARRGEMMALHLFDLDHFKHVNDTLGHPAGDKLLQLVGQRLKELIRQGDTVSRTGGDEFALIQTGLTRLSDASALAERVIKSVSAPYNIDGHEAIVGTSIGIAIGPSDGDHGDQLIRNADLALYRSKAEGRCTYRFFAAEMDTELKTRRAVEADLRKAIIAGEFELHYQPLVRLSSNEITGCEALLRWRHPHKGMIPPDGFIPLAEETGAIIPLGEWVIREACKTAANWPDSIRVSVNLSPVQLRNVDLAAVVKAALSDSGLRPSRLELEITENVMLSNSEAIKTAFNKLRELGVRIALDDFGAGYSSLGYLRQFLFDNLKIDRCFVKDIVESSSSRCIVHAIAEMAKGLGMITTAEGVETAKQRAAVLSAGCMEMQGYFVSRPLPVAQIEQLLKRGDLRTTNDGARSEKEVGTPSRAAIV